MPSGERARDGSVAPGPRASGGVSAHAAPEVGRRAERTVHAPAARSAQTSAAERSPPSIVASAPRKPKSSSTAPPGATGITRQPP